MYQNHMVVEIDDSGWGDLLGGVIIVLRRNESNDSFSGEIPLEMFQGTEFKYQEYLRIATQIILEGIDQLQVFITEPIRICTGYVFTTAKKTLHDLGYDYKEVKIIGKTQDYAENEFIKSLVRLGVGEYHEVREMRSFNGFISWVKQDLDKREQFVKTGWKSWKRHRVM